MPKKDPGSGNKFLRHYRKLLLMLVDTIVLIVAYLGTWILISGRVAMEAYFSIMVASCVFFVLCFVIVYYLMGMYDSLWRYAEIVEFFRFCMAAIIAVITFCSLTLVMFVERRIPTAAYFMSSAFAAVATLMIRLVYRMYRNTVIKSKGKKRRRTLIIGAGEATSILLREQGRYPNEFNFIGVVDDDVRKVGRNMMGLTILGTTQEIPALVEKCDIETILLSIPTLDEENRRRILSICAKTKCNIRILPDIVRMISGEDRDLLSRVRDVRVEDLLGRQVISLTNVTEPLVKDKVVMVTGGGGSIGSELCRQIAANEPRQLIIVDIYENNAYAIQQELLQKYGTKLDLKVLIASVRDSKKMDRLFDEYRPQLVFHAAAHKHVPLMEDAPEEAVKNNIFGTYNVANAADRYGAERFVLISTDKAVNPTNVMGATKRVCEMVIQSMAARSRKTLFMAVRFGNVLGSNGSVIPLFKEQIEAGGPVTVTHPDIVRYFMTVPEAVSLVLEAAYMGRNGRIFVLDMGKPVKILELAENLIKMAGFIPYKDIKIVFSGLRPGEKLYEELLMDEEGLMRTDSQKIFIGQPLKMDIDSFFDELIRLKKGAYANNSDQMLRDLSRLVPTFKHVIPEEKKPEAESV